MVKKIGKYISLTVTVVIAIAALKLLFMLPDIMQQDTIRRYESIEAVSSRLDIKEIFVPKYFPQSIKWPPSEILAQRKPFVAVIMGFKSVDDNNVDLIIHQSMTRKFIQDDWIPFKEVREEIDYELNGKKVKLEVGVCGDGRPCSRIEWREENYMIKIVMRSAPFELIKIAESMNQR